MGGAITGEGRYVVPGGDMIHALPAVFVAYAALALLTGVVLHVFRGNVSSGSGSGGGAEQWASVAAAYTRWTTVGVLGFCGGVLATSMVTVGR